MWLHGLALLRPPKQAVLCYPYLLGGAGPKNMPPNKTSFFFFSVISYALNAITSLSLTLLGFLLEDEWALAVPLLFCRGTADFCSDTAVT